MEWTVLKLIQWTTDYFKKRGIPSARLDGELLLAHVLKCNRVQLYTRFDLPLGPDDLSAFKALVTRRGAREPVAYLLGHKEFWSLDFEVGPGVLVPRPDTERLVEEVIRLLGRTRKGEAVRKQLPWNPDVQSALELAMAEARARKAEAGDGLETAEQNGAEIHLETTPLTAATPREEPATASALPQAETASLAPTESGPASLTEASTPANPAPSPHLLLDLCTGSGIIPICAVRECHVRAIGVDCSPDALEYARRNVSKLCPEGSVALLEGDLFAPVPRRFYGRIDLLTANPPYIPAGDMDGLEAEVRQHEPRLALVGGDDGLELYRRIAHDAPRVLRPGGWILLEVGTAEQGTAVMGLLEPRGFGSLEVLKDLAGTVRVVKGQLQGQGGAG